MQVYPKNPGYKPFLPSFSKRGGKVIRQKRRQLLVDLLPKLLFRSDDLASYQKIWLEVGFGSGEHLAHRAVQNPDILFIGCEVYENGIAKLLEKVNDSNLKNIRIFNYDARLLLQELPENSLDRVFILFPDPWPKKKHHKRRVINQQTLEMLRRVMKDGAMLNIATDHDNYAEWIMVHMAIHGGFEWNAENHADWQSLPPDHITTRYQHKSLAGRPVFLNFNKKE